MMELLVYDRDVQYMGTIGPKETGTAIISDNHDEIQGIYEFDVAELPNAAIHLDVGMYIGFWDVDNYFQLFEIRDHKPSRDKKMRPTKWVYAEHVRYELLNDIITDKRPQNVQAAQAVIVALEGTRWQLGTSVMTTVQTTNYYYESALSALIKVQNKWNVWLRYRLEMSGNSVSARYVDILEATGRNTGKRFEYDRDLTSVHQTVTTSSLATALYGRGRGEEVSEDGYGRRIDFGEVVWSKAAGDPADKPAGREWIGDPDALAQWGRDGRHRFGVAIFEDCEDVNELIQLTWDELQNRKEPKVSYDTTVIELERVAGLAHEAVRLWDIVRVIDYTFTPPLLTEAEVIDIQRSYVKPTATQVKLGNYAPSIIDTQARMRIDLNRLLDKEAAYDLATYNVLPDMLDLMVTQIISSGTSFYTDKVDGSFVWEADDGQRAVKMTGAGMLIASSKTGGTWNWSTALSGSGIVASAITTGTLNANLIRAGLLSAVNGASWLDMVNGQFNFGSGKLVYNGSSLSMTDGECVWVSSDGARAVRITSAGIQISASKSGGNWVWSTAITGAGIVADAITTGILNADRIKAGQLSSVDGTSWLNMANGRFSFGGGRVTYDGSSLGLQADGSISLRTANFLLDLLDASGDVILHMGADTTGFDQMVVRQLDAANHWAVYDGSVSISVASGQSAQTVIDSIDKHIDEDVTVQLSGTRTESLIIQGYHGHGRIILQGSATIRGDLVISGCGAGIVLENVTLTAASGEAVHIERCQQVTLKNCVLSGASGTTNVCGLYDNANVVLDAVQIDNGSVLVNNEGSYARILDCTGQPTSGGKGITTSNGGITVVSDTVPSGGHTETKGGQYFGTGAADPGETPTPPPGEITTVIYKATVTRSYRGSNWRTDNDRVYQGLWENGSNHYGHMFFNLSSLRSTLTGKQILNVKFKLKRVNGGGASSSRAVHLSGSNRTGPSGTPSIVASYGVIGTWRWGQTMQVQVDNQVVKDLVDGTTSSLALFIGTGDPYMIMMGATEYPPELEIMYQ